MNHQRATSTQRASTQWVHFHVPVMEDTLEMGRFAEVYKYWTTAAWCNIVTPLSMKRQTCVTSSIKHCSGSSSSRYPGLRCCFYLLNEVQFWATSWDFILLLRDSNLLELGRKYNLWDQGTSKRIANYRLMVFDFRHENSDLSSISSFLSLLLSFLSTFPFHSATKPSSQWKCFRVKAVNCWPVLSYFLKSSQFGGALTFSN